MEKLLRKIKRALGCHDRDYYDMAEHAGEQFYGRLYGAHIARHLENHFGKQSLKICDAGCQSGRLALPLARAGYRVTGIERSQFALKRAAHRARQQGLSLNLRRGDILKVLSSFERGFFDGIVCLEVLYLNRNFREILKVFRDRLQPSGLVFVSHRSSYYYVAKALGLRDFDTAHFVLTHQEGELWNSYFNWQTLEELEGLYGETGFSITACYPIGLFSGIGLESSFMGPDPISLEEEDRAKLEELELETSRCKDWKTLGRYILIVATPGQGTA